MRLLKRMISAFLAVCMVISMMPMAALATETDSAPGAEGRIILNQPVGQTSVWVDGVEYAVQSSDGHEYVDLPAGTEPGSMVTYTYHVGDPEDVHSQYPVGMQVWALNRNDDGSYTPEQVEELDNILQYSGSSIRITGNKGIRMITSIEKSKKDSLISGGLGGYKLLEYGTVLAWSADLEGGNSLVLGPDYAKYNYAYKKDVADPIFAYSGNLVQYTNVLVGFSLDQCRDDIAMRSYMILEDENGDQTTVYGGVVHRSIGYIAWQNKDAFAPGSAAYNYVWEIIRHVYAEIKFETNGGSAVESAFVYKGSSPEAPADAVREGYAFEGWYLDEELTQPFNHNEPVNDNIVVYAKWTKLDSPSDTFTVTFEANNGSAAESQTVIRDASVTYPGIPSRDGYVFAGWYLDENETDLTNQYDFSAPVTSDLVLYAQWIDIEQDADQDGLPDTLEEYLNCDPNDADTDDDGLTDYQECVILSTDPTVTDSDSDGISDFNEDADSDGLCNGDEFLQGTDPICADSDFEGLTDGEEISLGTDPNKPDTDDDGAADDWEIDNGFSPVVYNSSFEVTATSGAPNVSVSVTTDVSGDLAASVEVTALVDHPILNSAMPGYVDVPFEFTVNGGQQNISATISFTMNAPMARSAVMQPQVYRYNADSQRLEELSTTVSGNTASATVTKCGIYVLLDKRAFDEVWENEIKPPIANEGSSVSHIDVAFVIDCSGSMSSNRRLITAKAALHTFIAALSEKDRAALIKFNTRFTVLSDLTIDKQYVDDQVDAITAGGNTSMYTGFGAALDMLSDPSETYGYKMIIILSDGSDVPSTSYNSKYAPLVEQAVANNIVVYTIGAGSSVNTSILTRVAEGTGGAYYTATVTEGITDAFDKIQEDTVDLVADSDEDGLPDYYEENLTTGSGVPLNLDIHDPDCDGDGLKDGEEVTIKVDADGSVYGVLHTDPWSPNTDGDGYSDYEEVKVFYSNPLEKNIVFMNEDTDFIIENENFVSDKYLDFYENKWIGWTERVCVFLGNGIFAGNWDQAYLYKTILMQYLEDMVDLNSAALQNRQWLEIGFDISKAVFENIDNASKILDDGTKAEDLKKLNELREKAAQFQSQLDNFSPDDLSKAGYASDQIREMSNDLFNEYVKVSGQIPELSSKVEFSTKVSKASTAIGVVFTVADVLNEGYKVWDEYSKFAAKIAEMDHCLNALQLIIHSSDANKPLKSAAQELYSAIEAEKINNMDRLEDILKQTGGKLLNEAVWLGLSAIAPPLAVVKAALGIVDFVFNLGNVSEQCACLFAISKSSTILAKDFRSTISSGYKVGTWTTIYSDYVGAADDYFALAVMRYTSENQMKVADQANSWLIEWLFTEFMYKLDDVKANLNHLGDIMGKYKFVVPGD